jgi:hypothetical protein
MARLEGFAAEEEESGAADAKDFRHFFAKLPDDNLAFKRE